MADQHARPGKSFMDMLQLILKNQRRPNDPFSPQLLMAIFWEETFFTNRKQVGGGTGIGFGQTEPAELPKLTTQRARDKGYELPGVSAATRELDEARAVAAPSCLLLHLFHAAPPTATTPEARVRFALEGYGGVHFKGKSSLTREDRLRIIANWRKCEEKLKALPFSIYTVVNFAGNLTELSERYMDALHLAKPFVRNFQFTTPPPVKVRDILFPPGWSLPGLGPTTANNTTATAPAPARPESFFAEIVTRRRARLPHGQRFELVAGPGEELPALSEGDLLVRPSPHGGPPRAARIRSAAAPAEDFFFEGVLPDRGPAGYYVEVAGTRPRARHIADAWGRVAPDTAVLRPQAADEPWADLQEETNAELARRRTALVAAITAADLVWHDVPLREGYRVKVSAPVLKDGLFVPVTAGETWQLARRLELLPLSRAVMDQAHNAARQAGKQATPDSLFDFVTYTRRLQPTVYGTERGQALTSGAHKLWVISARGPVINYGFYIPRVSGELVRCGPTLDPRQNVIQGLGAAHNAAHWDYSQLLQLMTGLRDASGNAVSLRQALTDRHPSVWDETGPPAPGSLP
jgi:hypothetical protein